MSVSGPLSANEPSDGSFTFTDPDSDSDQYADPIPVVGNYDWNRKQTPESRYSNLNQQLWFIYTSQHRDRYQQNVVQNTMDIDISICLGVRAVKTFPQPVYQSRILAM